jgi:sec-independent protein translocase protein TatC
MTRKEKPEKPSPDAMTLGEHLGELRRRVVTCAVAFTVAAVLAATAGYAPILHLLIKPLCEVNGKSLSNGGCPLYITNPLDGLSLRLKISMFGGLVLSSPVLLFQVWRFITPGMEARERKYAIPFVTASFGLFLLGAATAYLTLPHALHFLKEVGGSDLREIYDPIPYIGLILLMMTLFGLTFEFPVVLVSLELARIVTPARLLHSWRWAVITITVVAAVFTPSSDPFSMLALAIPLVVFYFISIGIGKLLGR